MTQDPQLDLTAWDRRYREQSADDFLCFVRGLFIDSARGPVLFDIVKQDFQMEAFAALEPSLNAVRDGTMPPRRRFWIERTKKAGKDSDMACCLLWLAAFSKRPMLIQVSAANLVQAGIVKERAETLLHYNPWLAELVNIQQYHIYGPGRLCRIVVEATGQAGGRQGPTPALLLLNELVHVDKWSVNETHMNNADGVPNGVVIICTNAGLKGSKAETWKREAEQHPERWTLLEWKGKSPWLNAEDIEAAKRRDPIGSEFSRLYGGKWVSATGDAVGDDALDRCFRLQGPTLEPELGWQYIAGLDLGVSHDHSGIVLLGIDAANGKLKVCWFKGYKPCVPNDRGRMEVDIAEVKDACRRIHKQFHTVWFGYDPAVGGSFLAQDLRKEGLPMRDVSFSNNANLREMCEGFVLTINTGRLECYDDLDGTLRRDMGKFGFKDRVPEGYRLVAIRDESGHADVGTALLICLGRAKSLLGFIEWFGPDDVMYEPPAEDEKEEKEERKQLKGEMAELASWQDELEKDHGGRRRSLDDF